MRDYKRTETENFKIQKKEMSGEEPEMNAETLTGLFLAADTDKNGSIDLNEFVELFNKVLSLKQTADDDAVRNYIKLLFMFADVDSKGNLSVEEFVKVMLVLVSCSKLDLSEVAMILTTLFCLIDTDNSGEIDFDEFKAVLPKIGVECSEEEAKKAFEEVDTDHSGAIDAGEFAIAFKELFE